MLRILINLLTPRKTIVAITIIAIASFTLHVICDDKIGIAHDLIVSSIELASYYIRRK